ncbi:glucose dehydrogenase [Caerostris darwini]|uniref:Glucose dehydrogenase n=1 Tax=Caerostris darwini TaxID=1538125 RepID=A0AAV4U782_9ARAC|nr:glucose dehydrogenase [Caerostris darwini]
MGLLQYLPTLLPFAALFYMRAQDTFVPFTKDYWDTEYDYIVVGGGSSGAVIASRLSEDPNVKVLLLEAGGPENQLTDVPLVAASLQQTPVDWAYQTEPQQASCFGLKGRRSRWPRGRVLGGSSVLNYMLYVRGNKKDYDNWERLGAKGWSWKNVLPYFLKSEDNRDPPLLESGYHATGGYLTVSTPPYATPLAKNYIEAGLAIGYPNIDINGERQGGWMIPQGTIRRGARCSTSKAFLMPTRGRKNLDIVVFAHATKILFDAQKRARAVQFDRLKITNVVNARKEIILSAGAINSPQLLMLSGIGPRHHLQQLGVDSGVSRSARRLQLARPHLSGRNPRPDRFSRLNSSAEDYQFEGHQQLHSVRERSVHNPGRRGDAGFHPHQVHERFLGLAGRRNSLCVRQSGFGRGPDIPKGHGSIGGVVEQLLQALRVPRHVFYEPRAPETQKQGLHQTEIHRPLRSTHHRSKVPHSSPRHPHHGGLHEDLPVGHEHAVHPEGRREAVRIPPAGLRPISAAHGPVPGVPGQNVHGHPLPSGGNMQNGPRAGPHRCRRPPAQSERRPRTASGRRLHYARDSVWEHQCSLHYDWRKSCRSHTRQEDDPEEESVGVQRLLRTLASTSLKTAQTKVQTIAQSFTHQKKE